MKKSCSYCGMEADFLFQTRDYNRAVTTECFDHYLCPQCGLIFITPIPQKLGDYYPDDYYFVPPTLEVYAQNAQHEQYKIDIVRQYVAQGRLLEIGPALSGFVYLAKQAGYNAEAIEMSAPCSAFLNHVAAVPTVNSSDTVAALAGMKPFDVVALWHVIEHLPDPWTVLKAISQKINPGGILVLAAPNPDAFQFKILGKYWPHVDAPRHVMLIPSQLLINEMAKLDMQLELLTTNDKGGLGWNVFGWEFALGYLSKQSRINYYLHRLGRLFAKFLSPLETIEGKGAAYTMVFRKAA